jgi:hypothetical protein
MDIKKEQMGFLIFTQSVLDFLFIQFFLLLLALLPHSTKFLNLLFINLLFSNYYLDIYAQISNWTMFKFPIGLC